MTGMCPPCKANMSSFWPDVSHASPQAFTVAPTRPMERGAEFRRSRAGRPHDAEAEERRPTVAAGGSQAKRSGPKGLRSESVRNLLAARV